MLALNLIYLFTCSFVLFIYVYFLDYWNYFRVLRKERVEGIPESLETECHIIENTTTNVHSVEFFPF